MRLDVRARAAASDAPDVPLISWIVVAIAASGAGRRDRWPVRAEEFAGGAMAR